MLEFCPVLCASSMLVEARRNVLDGADFVRNLLGTYVNLDV